MNRSLPSSSGGFGGIGPQVTTWRFSLPAVFTYARQFMNGCGAARKSVSPLSRASPRWMCWVGRRRSQSTRSTLSPAFAKARPSWAVVEDFPSCGAVLVRSTTFRSRFLLRKIRAVLKV